MKSPLIIGVIARPCVCVSKRQAPTTQQPHPQLLKATPTKHAHKATPIKHIQHRRALWVWPHFNDIHIFFAATYLPYAIPSGSSENYIYN